MTLLVVCYDIPDTRRRNRVARVLEGFGERVQKSVFECPLDAAGEAALRQALEGLPDPREDKLRFYALCAKDRALTLAWDKRGRGAAPRVWLL